MENNIKVLVAGDFTSPIHEAAISNAFENKGLKVSRFKVGAYFQNNPGSPVLNKFLNLWTKFQHKFKWGPRINRLNKDFIEQVKLFNPDLIFLYRPVFIMTGTIEKIAGVSKLFIYNNDDPFGSNYPQYVWRHYMGLLKYADRIFYYRAKNHADYLRLGYSNTELLRSYYIAEDNYRIPEINKKTNLLFIGHYENDGRDELMLKLFEANIGFELFGPEWHRSHLYEKLLTFQKQIIPLRGADYNNKINESLMCLVLLSKLNNDTYTRRCFEIPATGTMMVCSYTDDMAGMFVPDKEAVYFNNHEELIEKVKYYTGHRNEAIEIGMNGLHKADILGCEVNDRANQIISSYKALN